MTDAEQQVRAAGKLLGIDVHTVVISERRYFAVWLIGGPWQLVINLPSWEKALAKLQSLPGRDHG